MIILVGDAQLDINQAMESLAIQILVSVLML